ncbi:MAG: response regulator [Acidobacteriota bacterium]|nr:response regulator [Acidobacteriota bacterium]
MRTILFVDDEPRVLEGLERMLHSMRHEWEMAFAEGGASALETLKAKPFDVVVTDMRMPGMDGPQFLREVRERHPQIVRIVLSGHSDKGMIMKSVDSAHQYLSKPCTAESLKETVMRACALRDLLENSSLQQLVTKMDSLPSLPSLYCELVEELSSEEASIKKIGKIISRDLGMTAKILQMVNSAFFGLRRTVSNPAEACLLLGMDTIMSLVLTIHVFSQFKAKGLEGFSPDALWSHCIAVGRFAKHIAQMEQQDKQTIEDSFTAGLLHDSGRVILAATLPDWYQESINLALSEELSIIDAEREVFGTTHAEVGAYLLGLWGLPYSIVESVAFHHKPSQSPEEAFTPLMAVHIADYIEAESCSQRRKHEVSPPLDRDYLSRLKLAGRLPAWMEGCRRLGVETLNIEVQNG